ncbi:MAG TPA: alpha-galactosidase [Jatrophihabitans sp.]|nr:alpha-galactosidase [Jatrophihabitans sp.]
MSSPRDLPLLFPSGPAEGGRTALLLVPDGDRLPLVGWLGLLPAAPGGSDAVPAGDPAADLAAVAAPSAAAALLPEHSRGTFRRPGLRGHRLAAANTAGDTEAGHDWSTAFELQSVTGDGSRCSIAAADRVARLALRTDVEALTGGALRIRHTLTNTGDAPFVVDGLDVAVPLPERATELLDFSGRHERERSPQRSGIRDGLWLRESRRGRTGLEAATMLIAGTPGFGFGSGELVAVHVGWSGNSSMWVERDPAGAATVGGGELLLPGEVVLTTGEEYTTPWVYVVAGDAGLDSVAAPLHEWQRSLRAHPGQQPVLINVWEAVYFDHDLDRLTELADRAARIGVQRFVLDDGWFAGRRSDDAGLGDWWVDEQVWPKGLHPLVDHVRGLGLQFGLWFEPEMVNPDSELFQARPDWVLHAGERLPSLARNQLVLDLGNPDVFDYLLGRIDALLDEYPIDYVKWDHNRDLLDAGSSRCGVPAVHRQAQAHYDLLDELRRRHPNVEWESCASGGGRIDLGVLERVQRVWTSDMTDALSRQAIQRWTGQLVAPEYLGAHVSARTSHQTGRTLPLDFRAGTALFGSFGLELDLTKVDDDELDALAAWIARYERFRPLLHGGRVVRPESSDPAVWLHGVVAKDGRSALMAHVQLDESESNRGVRMRIPHLSDDVRYDLSWVGPVDTGKVSQASPVDPAGPTGGRAVSGAVLRAEGVWIPRRRPETMLLLDVTASG